MAFDTDQFERDLGVIEAQQETSRIARHSLNTIHALLKSWEDGNMAGNGGQQMDRIEQQLEAQDEMLRALLAGMQSLLRQRREERQAGSAVDTVDMAALGKSGSGAPWVNRAVQEVFGSKGAKKVRYDKTIAYQLIQKGLLTSVQHRVWKKTGLLAAAVDVGQGRAGSRVEARPL